MDSIKKWYNQKMVEATVKNLILNNYEVHTVSTKEEAKKKILDIIEEGSTIGLGGSVTLNEIGIIPELRSPKYKLLDRYKEGLSREQVEMIFRENFFADYLLTSTNAITKKGELVNLDGTGNRVSAMIFGPKKVIIVAGYNKIVETVDDAVERVRKTASPLNCKRLNRKTPCTVTGECADCRSPERICNQLLITYRQNVPGRTTIIIVEEELGY